MHVKLYLVRHGRTELNDQGLIQGRIDPPLNAVGVEQARHLGHLLKDVHFDEVLRSPLKRCEMTANEIIASLPTKPPVKVHPGLNNRGMGSWEGRVRHYYIPEPDDAETLQAVDARVAAWLKDLLAELATAPSVGDGGGNGSGGDGDGGGEGGGAQPRRILVVSHENVVLPILNHLVDPAGPIPTTLGQGVVPAAEIENGEVSRVALTYENGRWSAVIESWGEEGHVGV